MILPKWIKVNYGYYNKIGVYRTFLINSYGFWRLEIWDGQKNSTEGRKIFENHFIINKEKELIQNSNEMFLEVLKKIK